MKSGAILRPSEMMKAGRVLAVVGPTASGKTPLALLLAQRLDGEIVSADSRQCFCYLDIGTAKPTPTERAAVQHHFIDILDPSEEYSAGRYGAEARTVMMDILRRRKTPILVGGSGLYIRAVLDGLFEGPGKDHELRRQLEEKLRSLGAVALLEELRKVDPPTAEKMIPQKPRPIIRALEVYYATGKPLSEFHAGHRTLPPFEFVQFALEWPRRELYARIDERVNRMMRDGLLDEVKSLLARGYDERVNALNTVGYKELIAHLQGHIPLDEAVRQIKQHTRNFVKRQLTWFRADQRIRWIAAERGVDFERIAEEVAEQFHRG